MCKKHKIIVFSLLLIITLQHILSAQIKMVVSGEVLDAISKEPLAGANIFLKSDYRQGTISNPEGNFQIQIETKHLPDTLIVSFIGFREKKIPLVGYEDVKFTVPLFPFSRKIDETIIRGKRIIAEEFTIKQIKQLDIYLNPLSKADPLLAVNSMPSSTTLDESASISFRGSSPAETGIFFNQVPVYDAVRFSQLNGIGTFSIFNTAIVKQLHVFPGNPPLEFGNTTAGLISIQTENQVPEENNYGISVSIANFGGLMNLKLSEKAGFTLFSNYQPPGIFLALNNESLKDLKDFRTIDLGFHYLYEPDNRTKIKLFNYANTERYEFNLRHPSYLGSFNQNKKRNFTIGNYTRMFDHGEFTLNAGLSFSREKYDYGNTDINLVKQDRYLSLNYLHFWEKLSFKSGFSFDSRKNRLDGRFPQFTYAIGDQHPEITVNSTDLVPVSEVYFYTKYKITPSLILGGGIRKNIPAEGQKNFLSRQVNTNYQFLNNNSINLSVGKYHKYNLPNADIHGSFLINSNQFTIDYKHSTEKSEFTASFFHKKVECQERMEKIWGSEFFLKIYLHSRLQAQLSYTYINAKVKKENIEYPSRFDLNYFIRGSLKYQFMNNFNISAILLSRQGDYYNPVVSSVYDNLLDVYQPYYEFPIIPERIPDYVKLDLSISKLWTLYDNISIVGFFSINNLFDRKNVRLVNYNFDYSDVFYESYSRRTFYFGVQFIF